MSPLGWILTVGAVYRLTLLAVADEITAPWRDAILRAIDRGAARRAAHQIGYLLTCPWCASIWIAFPAVAVGLAADPAPQPAWGWQLVVGALTASAAAGFLTRFASPD